MKRYTSLIDLIGSEKLQKLQERFYKATGFPNSFVDAEGNYESNAGVAAHVCMNTIRENEGGRKRCVENDVRLIEDSGAESEPKIYKCHAGIWDVSVPIIAEGKCLGFIFIGQCLTESPKRDKVTFYATDLGIDPDLYWKYFKALPIVPYEKIENAANLLIFMATALAEEASSKIRVCLEAAKLKKTEKELRECEQKYRMLFEQAADSILILDLKTDRLVVFNDKAYENLGYTRSEFEKLIISDFEVADNPEEIKAHYKKIITEGADTFKTKHRRKDGEIRDMLVTARMISVQGKQLIHFICRDITELKLAEDALREERDNAQRYLDLAGVIFAAINTKGEVTLINKKGCEVLGYDEEEIIGKNWFDNFLPERSVGEVKPVSKKLLAGEIEGTEYFENPILTKNKEERLIAWHNTIMRNEKAEIYGHLSSGEDITERKKAEEALRTSEEKYRALEESSSDAILMLDAKRDIISCNQAFLDLFGYTIKEVEGRSIRMIHLSDEDFRSFGDATYQAIEIFRSHRMELAFIRKDGSIFPAETVTSMIKSPSGLQVGYVAIIRDITKRKSLDAQLRQTQKMETIGTLACGIAHEFNNILSAIIGYTELALLSVEQDSQPYNYLQEVFRAGNRAKELVKQILAFSRQTEVESKPIQVRIIVNEALKFLRTTLPTTIEVRQNIQSDALVMADPTQIHQMLMNLCTNADHAMREKGGVLEVKLEDVELDADFTASHPNMKPGAYVKLTVSDTGHGMPPDVLERIFDPFFSTKETGERTGMGLSVVHGIVENYEGVITADSEPGQGSTFKFYLPIIERRKEPRYGAEDSIPTGSERILFVDDEPALANIGKQTLESLGYDVETRTSSIEALELFKAQHDRFDLVITDMTMPHLTGEDLAQELMRIKSNIPIFLCTGFSTKIDDQKASAMGIRAFVSKPVLRKEIAETIEVI